MCIRVCIAFCAVAVVMSAASAMEKSAITPENERLVPRHLLALLHAPEVQQELELTVDQVRKLEAFFGELDGEWFRSRIQTADKQAETMRSLESRVHQWMRTHLRPEQIQRTGQIECQAQSIRMMCRVDVAREIGLTPTQTQKFATLAQETESQRLRYQQAAREAANDEAKEKLEQAVKSEQDALQTVLTAAQHKMLWDFLGEPFATSKLERIHPMAPELISVKHWVNSQPLTLSSLHGKVVLVHFYAFQCHNCHANFPIYQRWHDQLRDKGVVVLGIQTPETSSERDTELVRQAAAKSKLLFPILIDLDSVNWNAWGNTMWPTVYVVDKNGYLRYWWQGEMNWQGAVGDKIIEDIVAKLLVE